MANPTRGGGQPVRVELSTRLSTDSSSPPETTGTRLVRHGFFVGAQIGHWVLERRIGRGGMAEVWRATDVRDGQGVALKRISPALQSSPTCRALFLEEARIGMWMKHENLVRCFDVSEHEEASFMVLELVDGPSCMDLLTVAAARQESVPAGVAIHIGLETLRALAHLHTLTDQSGRNLAAVHRDVSPGNVLLGPGGVVKLADFGIVQLGPPRRAPVSVLQGKRGYMAPEQIAGDPVDLRADLFALGVLLTQLVSGHLPYGAQSELELLMQGYEARLTGLDALTPAVARVIRRALSQQRGDRFGSAAAMAAELAGAARDDGIEVGPHCLDACLAHFGMSRTSEPLDPPLRRCGDVASSSKATPKPEPPPRVRSSQTRTSARRALLAATGHLANLDAVSSPAYEFGENPKPAWRIALRPGLLPEILRGLARGRATGLLVARTAGREKRVYMQQGRPSYVASTDESELLGARLIAASAVDEARLEQAVSHARATGARLGAALAELEYVRPVVIVRTLIAQLLERYAELASWTEGELAFCPDAPQPERVLRLHRSPEAIVSLALRDGATEPIAAPRTA